ncbi:MAG: multiheme c-type cytochrome [Polyangiales bacterium]
MTRWLCMSVFTWVAGCTYGPEPLRSTGDDLSPSLMNVPALDVNRLAKTDDCADCHSDVASHWTHSAHAYASFDNPWYRASIDQFREHRGETESRFCAGCHDPLLLLSGDIDTDVSPDNELAYAGVTCLVCHSIESTRPDGNASFTLSDAPVLLPDPANQEEIEAHRARLTMKPLRTAALCGSCHRSFSGPSIGNANHLPGIDDLGDWASSGFAGAVRNQLGSVEQANCQGCHMKPELASDAEMAGAADGKISSHRWAASHTAMTAQLPDQRYADQAADALEGAVLVDVGAVRSGKRRYVLPAESRLRAGEHLVFDVLLENQRTGHRFPGGVRDLHDAWVEVEVRDAGGELLAVSRPSGEGNDDVFLMRATLLDAAAEPEVLHQVHRFAAAAFDRTLPAHEARAVRYSMKLPRYPKLPLQIDARLLHRKHSLAFQALACEASRTERGKAFALGAEKHGKVALDPCVEQPVLEVGAATVWMGSGATEHEPRGGAARPAVQRLLTQGLALLYSKQEHVEVARPSIERALKSARGSKSTELEARALVLRARLSAMQGRPREADGFLRRAEALVGPTPVFERVRGDANARVWRWKAAAAAYRRVVDASPLDWHAWRDLARAYGSQSDDLNALSAANAGLRLAPRDESLLRSRALALESLGRPEAPQATARWLAHRSPEEQSKLLAACEREYQRCRRDRQPIPHYTLAPPRKPVHAAADPI